MRRWAWLAALGGSGPLALLLLQCGGSGSAAEGDDIPLPLRGDAPSDSVSALDAPLADAASDPDAHARPPSCDPSKPFAAPVRLADFDPNAVRATPRLSSDELTIYFTSFGRDAGADL